MHEPFYFYTEYHLVRLLAIKAKNTLELLEGLKRVPASSIYYHTHRFLQQHHYLSPEPPNDFAYWLSNILNLKDLGEAFASVDTVEFRNMEELRAEFIKILESYPLKNSADCPRGQEFHFMACKTFVLPTKYVARDLAEFAEVLSRVSINSLYFHVFEARMRLEKDENDFAAWFRSMGQTELVQDVAKLDPYNITLEGLRERIIDMVKKHA